MHLGVEGKTVVLQALDNVAFPQRAGKIQRVGMQPGYQDAKFPFTAGARQRRVSNVVVEIQLLVDLPGRGDQAAQEPRKGVIVAPGRRYIGIGFHAGEHVS